jgi:asparagine synthase (glutamine-hydrolysing)
MSVQVDEVADVAQRTAWHDRWIVEVGPVRPEGARRGRTWRAADGSTQLALEALDGSDLTVAEDRHRVVLFAGVLTNARELRSDRGAESPAATVLGEFAARSQAALEGLRGPFAVVVWDKASGEVLTARDQIGIAPLFYARAGSRWLFSSSPEALVADPGVSREIDAVALSEWLCGWYPAPEDTAYRFVKRVPPATAMSIGAGGTKSRRYWDPAPEDGPIEWLRDDEVAQFDARLTRAVERAIECVDGPPAVFLSGGLDSISVALKATDVSRAAGRSDPLALSLAFPEGESNEETIQAGVARQLGIRQRLVPFADAIGPEGLIQGALTLSAGWPQPMFNAWAPAYMHLASLGAADGARVVLTGRGGDEWLTITPYLLADLFGRGDVAGAWRLLQTRRRSNNLRGRAIGQLIWLSAGRPLLSAALDTVAPGPWHRRRRARLLSERPSWLAADPAIRAAMDERAERSIAPARPKQGFYMREARLALTHPAVTHDMEETQELGRRHGQRVLHPFWDVDLVSMLYRTRPETLVADGQFKWLLRRLVAPRLPNLGLERRGKMSAAYVFRGIVGREFEAAWRRLGGLASLGRLGIVDPASVQSSRGLRSSAVGVGGPSRLWSLLNLESWVRPRS